jgi:hypothetical protein
MRTSRLQDLICVFAGQVREETVLFLVIFVGCCYREHDLNVVCQC